MYFDGLRMEQVTHDLFGGYVNSYIIETENNIYMIDANIERSREVLEKTLADFPIGEKPFTVLITHGHWDHVGLAGWLKEKYGARILASKASERMMSEPKYQLDSLYDRFAPEYIFSDKLAPVFKDDFVSPTVPDGYIEAGDVITDTGFTLEVIATPGHCADELSFYNPENRLLFCGDTVQGRGYNGNTALYEDAAALRATLNMLLELKPKALYGGHFCVCTPDACASFIKESLGLADEIDAFLKTHSGTHGELTKAFCKEYGFNFGMHALTTMAAHM